MIRPRHHPGPVAPPAAQVAAHGPRPWSPLLVVVSGMMLAYVWRIQDLFPILAKVRFPAVILLVAVVLFVLDARAQRLLSQRIRARPILLGVAILFLAALSVPTSLHQGHSFAFVTETFNKTIFLMLLVLAAVRDRHDLDRMLAVLFAGAFLLAWTSLGASFRVAAGRLSGATYYDPNDLALVMVMMLPVALYFLTQKRLKLLRFLSLPALAFFLYIVIQTGSRGGFLALLGVTVYLVLAFRTVPARLRVGALAAGILVFSVAASDQYWDTMRTILSPQDDYNWAGESDSGRFEVWKRGLGYMAARPLFGVGADAFHQAEGRISDLAERQQYGIGLKWSSAHNAFIQIGAELGVLALLTFVSMLWLTLRNAWAASQEEAGATGAIGLGTDGAMGQALVGSLVAFSVGGFFLSQAYAVILYVIVGLVAVLTALRSTEATRHQPARSAPSGAFRSRGAFPHPPR